MNRSIMLVLSIVFIGMTSCQRELHFDYSNLSEGSLKSNLTGDCFPSTINGVYRAGSATDNNNYINVQVDVTLTGTYDIVSDTINGYSFRGTGIFTTTGLNTVSLSCSGKPLNAGIDLFTIRYSNSLCRLNIPVSDSSGNALFILGGSPATCSGFTVNGIYKAGIFLNSGNSADLTVNVIIPGPYSISTTAVDGMIFSAAGNFLQTGTQHLLLTGSGIPAASGIFNITASNGNSNCTFSIIVADASPASYTLEGSPGTCSGAVIDGNYVLGIPLTASNTASVQVNVLSPGSYSISSPVVNGIIFSKTGIFTSTGLQTVVLIGNGTPAAIGTFNHVVSGGSSSCTFSVDYLQVSPLANYSLIGGPGNCSSFILGGAYIVGVPMTAANTLQLQVDVVSTGSYFCSTPPVSGIVFQKSGMFTSTGLQTITLSATGNPTTAGLFTFTPQTTISSVCRFDLIVSPASTDVLKCKIDGTADSFNTLAAATTTSSPTAILISGDASPGSTEKLSLQITKASGNITTGTYTDTQLPSGISLLIKYTDPSSNSWQAISGGATPFTITINSINTTRATGVFSGTLKDANGTGPNSKIITEGAFDVPVN